MRELHRTTFLRARRREDADALADDGLGADAAALARSLWLGGLVALAAASCLPVSAAESDTPAVYFKETPQAGVFFADAGRVTAVARNDAGDLSVNKSAGALDGSGAKGHRLKADRIVREMKDVQGAYLGGTVVRDTRSLAIDQASIGPDGTVSIKDAGGCTFRGTAARQQALWRVSGNYAADKGCAVAGEAASGTFVAVLRPDIYARLVLAGALERKAGATSAVWIEADRP